MTWGELKKRAKELGLRDSDQIGISQIDDEGMARLVVHAFLPLKGPLPMFPKKRGTSRTNRK